MDTRAVNNEWRCDGRLLRETEKIHSFSAKPIPAADALMKIVENTLNLATHDEPNEKESTELEELGPIIHKISCELSSNCSGSQGSLEQRTLKLLILLERYNWEAKIAIVLAGFATNFAEFFLIKEVYNTDKNTAIGLLKLKRLGQKDTGDIWETVNVLVRKVTDIGKSILVLKKIQDNLPTVSVDIIDFQSASFWVIYSVLIISSAISGDRVTTELVSTVKRIEIIYSYFSLRLKQCQDLEQEEKIKEKYGEFTRIFGARQADNMEILKLLLCCGEEEELICNSTEQEKKIKLSDLKKGTIIVLFSSLHIDAYSEEVSIIKAFYNKTITTSQYRIVWLPIGYKREEHRTTYAKVVVGKPWYHLKFESLAEQYVVLEKYSRKEWGFNEKPMPMVLHDGQVIHNDALSLIHMWGHRAFPFRTYEEDLWREYGNSMGIQFILDYVHDDFTILGNDQTPQYVCVFGGRRAKESSDAVKENGSNLQKEIEWFADLAGKLILAATGDAKINLKMGYLGDKEEAYLEKNIRTKVTENIKLSKYQGMKYVQIDQVRTKLFWSRVKSVALQLNVLKETKKLNENMEALLENTSSILQYSLESTAWVAIGRLDTNDMIFYDAEQFFKCLVHINKNIATWQAELKSDGADFINILRRWLHNGFQCEARPLKKHCFKHIVYGDAIQTIGMKCVICYKPMKKVVLYQCCDDDQTEIA
ncbi:Sieve element occlusion protein [Rhynchospora pubera]|uniref:Sieve element occlusion protein n=1 Tax=Rhynchospora pubera TaxID=906938 RepID=A0AAV8HTH3_9POAL|nr:Sieve element occlusion protein [Rhynchospora pubera]